MLVKPFGSGAVDGNLPIATYASADTVDALVAVRGGSCRSSEEEGKEKGGSIEHHVRPDLGMLPLRIGAVKMARS